MLATITHVHIPYATLAIVTALSFGSALAQDASVSLSPAALREIAQVEAEIDRNAAGERDTDPSCASAEPTPSAVTIASTAEGMCQCVVIESMIGQP